MVIVAKYKAKSGTPLTASQKLNHALRAQAARVVLDGFPRTVPFSTPEEVSEYLNSDLIQCLRCGKSYRSLNRHLNRCHSMTANDYRKFYCLPVSTGLVCNGTRAKLEDIGRATLEKHPDMFNVEGRRKNGKPRNNWFTKMQGVHVAKTRFATPEAREASRERVIRSRTGKPLPQATTDKLSREWVVTSPEGERFHVRNLKEFCRQRGLERSNIRKNAARPGSRGWKAVPADGSQTDGSL